MTLWVLGFVFFENDYAHEMRIIWLHIFPASLHSDTVKLFFISQAYQSGNPVTLSFSSFCFVLLIPRTTPINKATESRMPPKVKAPDFGSQDYWDQRFTTNTAPFDWLSTPETLDPLIAEALSAVDEEQPRILHVGCGSSLLSQHLKTHVKSPQQVHNVDYSKVVIDAERERELEVAGGDVGACARWDAIDLLDYASLAETCGRDAYSVIVDKSTSDAISCAEDVICRLPYTVSLNQCTSADNIIDVEPREIPVYPLYLMAVHLALVTKPGGRWIALSYTSERYPFLEGSPSTTEEDGTSESGVPDPRLLWTVIEKHQIEAKEQGDDHGVTHRPKVYHCVYVLQRTTAPLFTDRDCISATTKPVCRGRKASRH